MISMNSLYVSCVVTLFVCITQSVIGNEQYCYKTDSNPIRRYGTKTAYRDRNQKLGADTTDIERHYSGCEAVRFYYISRHGTRYPGSASIQHIQILLEKLQKHINTSLLCDEDKGALLKWRMRMKPSDKKNMGEEGWKELQGIGSRMKHRFPGLFNVTYNKARYEFRHTSKNRTRDSARAYVQGMFGKWEDIDITGSEDNDILWYYFYNCPRFNQEIKNKPIEEVEKFDNGPETKRTLEKIQKRMGLSRPLSISELGSLYFSCIFEYALYDDAPWCALLDHDDVIVMEYRKDLANYYEDMYGHEISYKRACHLVHDILNSFQDSKVAVHRFAHSAMVNGLSCLMGLFKDKQPLRADKYTDADNIMAKTSIISPMAANHIFILYNCTTFGYTVRHLFNEKDLDIPGCPPPCSMDKLRTLWKPIVDSCNLDKLCEMSQDNSATVTKVSLLFALIVTLIYTI